MQAPKILYLVTKSNWGGAQAYVYTLAKHFHETGIAVSVALGGTGESGSAPGTLNEKLMQAGIPTRFLPTLGRDISPLDDWRAFREILRTVRNERPTILHVNSSKVGGLGALAGRLAHVPHIVFTSHGLAYDEDRSALARALIFFSTWLTFLLCHQVITISSDNARRASRLPFCRHKVVCIYNGIAPRALTSRALSRAALLPSRAGAEVWIGTIAELTPNKALGYLIEAAAQLRDRGYTFTLCLIGEGEERATLEQQIVARGLVESVHLLGFIPEAATYLAAFDIFTLPSTKEGLPYVLLEAGLAGTAVVASMIPGTTDIIDSSTGLLVPPKDAAALAQALATLIDDAPRRSSLGTALKQKVERNFSNEAMFAALSRAYRF